MRSLLAAIAASAFTAAPLLAQEAEAHEPVNLLSPNTGLMFWTLLIFVLLMFILARYAFKPLTAAVEARERALEEAITQAKADRDKASALLADQTKALDAARAEAQKLIAESRLTGEKPRNEMLANPLSCSWIRAQRSLGIPAENKNVAANHTIEKWL